MWVTLIDNSGGVVAVFTIVLAVTTIMYVVVTARLLKQSKNAFLVDIVLRAMEAFWERMKVMRTKEKKEAIVFVTGWMEGYRKTFVGIDKRLGTEVEKLIMVCMETMSEEWEKEKEEEAKK